jgi:hypothetical protein
MTGMAPIVLQKLFAMHEFSVVNVCFCWSFHFENSQTANH